MSSLSWRINVSMNNKSQRTLVSPSSGTGATVVRALRSLDEPVLFNTGETDKMLAMLGSPSASNPELLEALEYNNSYPLYLCSPATMGVQSAALITTLGTKRLTTGVSMVNGKIDSLEDVTFACVLQKSSTEESTFVGKMFDSLDTDSYNYDKLKGAILNSSASSATSDTSHFSLMYKGAASALALKLTQSISVSPTYTIEETSTPTIIGPGSTFDSTDGTVTIKLKTGITSSNSLLMYFHVNLNSSTITTENGKIFALVVSKGSSSTDYMRVRVTKNVHESTNSVTYDNPYSSFTIEYMYKNIKGKYISADSSPAEFGISKDVVNAYGTSLNPEKVFSGNSYLTVYVNYNSGLAVSDFAPTSDGATLVTDPSYVILSGGYHLISDIDFTAGWNFYKDSNTYRMDLMFDASCDKNAIDGASSVRTGGFQPYVRVLLPIPAPATYVDYNSVLESKNSVGYAVDRGISLYFGYFKIQNNYSNDGDVTWIPMGEVAKRHADAIKYSYGGLATAWVDENGVGGQLTSGRILKAVYSISENDSYEMDINRINPIVYDYTYGPMITSRRTTVMDDSDYSFNDYSGIFDYILKRVVTNVLPYQNVKFNDADHRRVVKNKIEGIASPLTVAPYNVLNAYLVKCDAENNSQTQLDKEEFHVDMAVQVTAKSRWIYFTFTNTSQTITVEEALA